MLGAPLNRPFIPDLLMSDDATESEAGLSAHVRNGFS